MKHESIRRLPPLLFAAGFLLFILAGCAEPGIGGNRDGIVFVGAGGAFECNDPAYANVKKRHIIEIRFYGGDRIVLCKPENPFSADGVCPDFRCENPSKYSGDLVMDMGSRGIDLSDVIAAYREAKLAGNMGVAWAAIKLVLRNSPGLANDMWADYWNSLVLTRFASQPDRTVDALKYAADEGLVSAMFRLSEVYSKGEFGHPVDAQLSRAWKARARASTIPEKADARLITTNSPPPTESDFDLDYEPIKRYQGVTYR